jgi:predicted Zn-dependent protease
VFSKKLGDGRAGARVSVTASGIEATTLDGRSFHLGFGECDLEQGGASGKMIFCRNADRSLTIYSEDRGFANALAERAAGNGVLAGKLGALRREARARKKRGRAVAAAVIAAILLVLVGGYYGIMAGARHAAGVLPIEVDKKIGEVAISAMDLGGSPVDDPVVTGAVDTMVEMLEPGAAVKGFDFAVQVVDAEVLNAFALPGGQIVVYTELIEKSERPEQVAGVLAHEMAHVTLRHGLERIAGSVGVVIGLELLLGDASGLVGLGKEVLEAGAINAYSREQEDAADMEGVRMLNQAGIDAEGLASFFELMKEEQGEIPGAMTWLSTHPDTSERIAAVRARMAELPRRQPRGFPFEWNQVKRRAADPVVAPPKSEEEEKAEGENDKRKIDEAAGEQAE